MGYARVYSTAKSTNIAEHKWEGENRGFTQRPEPMLISRTFVGGKGEGWGWRPSIRERTDVHNAAISEARSEAGAYAAQ